MTGRIALVGGDEFRPGCEPMDRALLEATGVRRPSLLVVPTAAATQNPSKAAANGVKYFSDLGADASALMVLDAAHANDEALLSAVEDADVVYLTGGNPTHLLDVLRGSTMLEKMDQALGRGAILAGSSAGAMVLGSWMRFRDWRPALGVVPAVATFPHHERADPDAVSKDLAESAPDGLVVLGIDAGAGCLSGPDGWRVLGAGRVTAYYGGVWSRYSPGDLISFEALRSTV